MASRGSKQKKRATMRLVYIDFWSALKMSFLVSIIVAAITYQALSGARRRRPLPMV